MAGLTKKITVALLALSLSGALTAAQRGVEGQDPEAVPQAPRGGGQAGGGGGRGGGRGGGNAGPTGVTIAGEVPNYVPVTDAMLKKQDDGDWLMIRRDYSATDYSPL